MAIKITKSKSYDASVDNEILHTSQYGDILVLNKDTNSIDYDNFTHFDDFDDYSLIVDAAGNVYGIKNNYDDELNESISKININDEIKKLKNKYEIEKIEWVEEGENFIMIKASKLVIDSIFKEYENNNSFKPTKATDTVIFLSVPEYEIKLEDDNQLLDKLSDQDMKNVIQKSGIKLNGTENKDRLKGIIQGVLSSENK